MTPAARDAAAIAILDQWLAGHSAEQALTQWARASRFAGSGDREAVRDRVFQAIRCARSAAARAGSIFTPAALSSSSQADAPDAPSAVSGRALLLGLAQEAQAAPELWTGEKHAPAPLTQDEAERFEQGDTPLTRGERLDIPDWLLERFDAALGADSDPVLTLMRARAPVFIRVNRATSTRDQLIAELARDEIEASSHALSPHALEITRNPRRLRNSAALKEGRIELQDAASQAIAEDFVDALKSLFGPDHASLSRGDALRPSEGASFPVLDFCAGGGGKSLALAAHGLKVSAYDIDSKRMHDLPLRATRAGVQIEVLSRAPFGNRPAIFVDAPCSGSGSWRRAPEAKWRLTPKRLAELTQIQDSILDTCADLAAPQALLGYATCSVLTEENEDRVKAFLARHPGWVQVASRRLAPLDGGDGFFLAVLHRRGEKNIVNTT